MNDILSRKARNHHSHIVLLQKYFKKKGMKRLLYWIIPVFLMASCTPEEIEEVLNPDLEVNTDKTVYVITGSPADGYPYQIVKTTIDTVETIVGDSENNYWGLRVSNDKTQFICFKSPYDGTDDRGFNEVTESELWLFNLDGTNGTIITDLAMQGFSSMGYANWHPSGTHVVITASKSDDADGKSQLYLVSMADGTVKKISTRNVEHSHPCFSPDGKDITYRAYANTSDDNEDDFEVYYSSYDEAIQEITGEKRVTNNSFEDKFPYFSGDGYYITYNYTFDISSNVDRIVLYDTENETFSEFNDIQDKYSTKNAIWSDANTFYFEENITGKLNTYVRRLNVDNASEIKVVRDLNSVLNFRDPQQVD
ncbi:MAG: TolB family protein [Chitinophagales bacterium]